MFYSISKALMSEFTNRVTSKLSKGHDASMHHFRNVETEFLKGIRNAEIEFLKGVRTFIDEEIQFVDGWLERRSQPKRS